MDRTVCKTIETALRHCHARNREKGGKYIIVKQADGLFRLHNETFLGPPEEPIVFDGYRLDRRVLKGE